MDYPDFEGISDIQQTSAMFSSRMSTNLSPRNNIAFSYSNPPQFAHGSSFHGGDENSNSNQPSFLEVREYVENALGSWGLRIGYLAESEDNKQTLKCLMEMISQRYKDIESREKGKEKIAELQFEKNKYNNLLDQSKKAVQEKNRQLGKIENNYEDLKNKLKKLQSQSKRDKDEDKKTIMMLKGKNQQVMHEVKKREQELNRVKEQMKKNVGEKNAPKTLNFEVYEIPQTKKFNEESDKVELISERLQSEKKVFLKENLLLKEKIYDIREEIVGLAEWIDTHIFRQKSPNYKNSFIVNHNLLFRKECLVNELKDVIEAAKGGIIQIIDLKQSLKLSINQGENGTPNKRDKKSPLLSSRTIEQSPKNKRLLESKNFKKKTDGKVDYETRGANGSQKKEKKSEIQGKLKLKSKPSLTDSVKPELQIKEEDSLIFGEKDSDLSIISHISMTEVEENKKKFDKWDILFKE